MVEPKAPKPKSTLRSQKPRGKTTAKAVEGDVTHGLTPKQYLFVVQYLLCFNATRAAKLAGYSEKTAYSIGQENLKKPEIAAIIRTRIEEQTMGRDELLVRLSQHARGDLEQFVDIGEDGGWTLNLKKAKAAGLLPLVKKLKADRYGTVLELYSSQRAMEMIGKMLAVFVERQEVSGPGGGAIPVSDVSLDQAIATLGATLKNATPQERAAMLREYEQYMAAGTGLRQRLIALAIATETKETK